MISSLQKNEKNLFWKLNNVQLIFHWSTRWNFNWFQNQISISSTLKEMLNFVFVQVTKFIFHQKQCHSCWTDWIEFCKLISVWCKGWKKKLFFFLSSFFLLNFSLAIYIFNHGSIFRLHWFCFICSLISFFLFYSAFFHCCWCFWCSGKFYPYNMATLKMSEKRFDDHDDQYSETSWNPMRVKKKNFFLEAKSFYQEEEERR